MPGSAGYPMLELQILSINVLGLTGSFLKWSLFKWDQQLEKIWNLSVSQSDNESIVKDINWLKGTLSWVVTARLIIDRVLFLAYLANISTLLIRKWQDLLIFWMLLSFFKDIVLEIVVIITTFLLWYEDNVATPFLIEFIAEKTIWFGVSIYKWCTTLKWYMQLRRVAKFRKFTIIARKSIASIVPVPGKISHSMENVYLDALTARRSIYSDLRISKSVTTLITNDSRETRDTNDYYSTANDLSVAEKSMRILSITAEDVMDARARIQERSYWSEQDATAETSEAMKEAMKEYSLQKDEREMNASIMNESKADYLKDTKDHVLRKEDIIQFPLIAKELKRDDSKIALNARKKKVVTKTQKEETPLIKVKKVMVDEGGSYTELAYSSDSYTAAKIKDEESRKFTRSMQRSSSKDARDIKIKSRTSLLKLEVTLELEGQCCCIPISTKEEQTDQVDQKEHLCESGTTLLSVDSSENECFKTLEMPSCHDERNVRSVDIDNKIINSIDKRKFVPFMPDIVYDADAQEDKSQYSSTFRYSKYCLMKQTQEFEASSKRSKDLVNWGSMSLAETAHPSGYEKNAIAIDKPLVSEKHVQTKSDDSYNSLITRYRLRYVTQMQNGRSPNLRSVRDTTLLETSNYAEDEKTMQLRALKTFNGRALLENERDEKPCKKHDVLQNCVSVEDRKAIELKTLKAYNKLTLTKYKKELEIKRKHDSSLINQRSMKESDASEMNFSCNDLALLEDRKKMETIKRQDSLLSCKRSSEEQSCLRARNELTLLEDRREPEIRGKYNLSKHETSVKYEKNVEIPTSSSDRFSADNHEESTTSSAGTGRNFTSGHFDTNNCEATRRVQTSLNLKEITRNIKWTIHPTSQGIILTNKDLHGQFLENDRLRDNQQRDIVDDSTVGTLHSAFFYKPEITRLSRAPQTRMSESSLPSLPTFWREDFNAEFVCRVRNEMTMRYQDSLLDSFDLEQLMADCNDFGATSMTSDSTNSNAVPSQENNRDLCTICTCADPEQVGRSESHTAIAEDPTMESRKNARSNAGDVYTTSATNDNLPLQFIVNVLRNLGAEVSQGNVYVASSPEHALEEHADTSNGILDDGFGIDKHITNDIHFNEDGNNESKVSSLDQNENIVFEDPNERAPNVNDNDGLDDGDVVLLVSSSDSLDKSQEEKYFSTVDVHFEKEMYGNDAAPENVENNVISPLPDYDNNDYLEFDRLINTNEESSCLLQDSSQLSGLSVFESTHYCASRSSDEELRKLTHLLGNEIPLETQGKPTLLLDKANGNTILQFQSTETPRFRKITEQTNAENENNEANDVYEMATGFTVDQFSEMNSGEKLRQDDSFDSTYDRSGNSETAVSLEEGSLMEEFSNDTVSLRTASNASIRISA